MTKRSMYEELKQGLKEMKESKVNKEIVIDCKSDGVVEGMHFDEFDLNFLGKKSVSRASEIFHNEETDMWDVLLPDQAEPHSICKGFSGYDVARKFEVEWLQECRKRGTDPASYDGAVVAMEVRR